MQHLLKIAALPLLFGAVACAATLQQLSMDQLSRNATAIVRATVAGSYTSVANSTVYTHYKLQVAETWKGVASAEAMLPGGVSGGIRQSFSGVPELSTGSEYVLFLWKSPSTGIMHVLGLTQGLYNVSRDQDGTALAWRPKIGEMMLDSKGQKVADQAISLKLTDLKLHVRNVAAVTGLTR
jgi:hypothetical protein